MLQYFCSFIVFFNELLLLLLYICVNFIAKFVGELDNGETLKAMITSLETFFDADIAAVLLVMGGAGMAFHYKLLNEEIGGVPPTLAVGDPVSGKSTAVEAALSVFDQRECIGGK